MSFEFHNPHAATAFSKDPTTKDQKRIEDPAHLAYIRRLPSLVSGLEPCEACHIRFGDPRAAYRKRRTPKGRKPDDVWTVPLTAHEHRLQHSGNEQAYWSKIGIDPLKVAKDLYAVSGDIEAGREIIARARRAAE